MRASQTAGPGPRCCLCRASLSSVKFLNHSSHSLDVSSIVASYALIQYQRILLCVTPVAAQRTPEPYSLLVITQWAVVLQNDAPAKFLSPLKLASSFLFFLVSLLDARKSAPAWFIRPLAWTVVAWCYHYTCTTRDIQARQLLYTVFPMSTHISASLGYPVYGLDGWTADVGGNIYPVSQLPYKRR